jgi:ATP-dependent protease HslVU (ClpYQ) peptidase subunit
MSVAVAVASRGQIVIAADTRRTFGSGVVTTDNFSDLKIRKVGQAYIAATGWGLYNNILDDYLEHKRRARIDDQRSIFTFFRHFWKDLHERYSFVSDQRPDDESPFGDLDASFLIVSSRGIFSVACDLSITRFSQYYAIGSGAPYALGALHAVYGERTEAEQAADVAVKAAMALDIYCGGAITSFSVRDARPAGAARSKASKASKASKTTTRKRGSRR